MLELLSFLSGGLFRIAPEVMKVWDRGNERKHELLMLGKQLEVDQARGKIEMQKTEIEQRGAIGVEEIKAMVAALQDQMKPSQLTGIKWLDYWNGFWDGVSKSVRPVLTYWFCIGGYGSYKTALYVGLTRGGLSWDDAITEIWTEQDHQVMWSIIGFWFVDRALKYVGR